MSTPPTQNLHEEAYSYLMGDLSELDLRGLETPSDLVLVGDHAFPLAMNSHGQVVMAASLYGRGRIVVLGLESYLDAFPDLVGNALNWLRGDGPDNSPMDILQEVKVVAADLSRLEFNIDVKWRFRGSSRFGTYMRKTCSVDEDAKGLVGFLKAGGGVLMAGEAWSWAQTHPMENVLLLFEGNKVSGVAGIYFTERRAEAECLAVHPHMPSSWMSDG